MNSSKENTTASSQTDVSEKPNRKKYLIITALAFLLILAVALFMSWQNQAIEPVDGFKGNIIDITQKNGQEIEVLVGDKIIFTLTGLNGEGHQWSAKPFSGDQILTMARHVTEGFVPMNKGENFYSYWEFIAQKPGVTNIRFEYETPLWNEIPKDVFTATVTSKIITE